MPNETQDWNELSDGDDSLSFDSTLAGNERMEALFARYLDLLLAGHTVDLDEVAREHPDIGTELVERLRAFQDVGSSGDDNEFLGTLGGYDLMRPIGRGGMGVVYEAWESSMDRSVAVKILPGPLAVDDRAVTRFMREARLAGKLKHPNVVSVYGMGVKEQTPYYAMEYVEGETLAEILARLKAAEPDAETSFGKKNDVRYFANIAEVFADVAEGLEHAHSKGVTHRDIKPSNLIRDGEGRLRILDFGLARLEGQESLTVTGDLLGTPLYMSPEQARRRQIPIDHRTDIYSLGTTLYETLAGRPPFEGKSHADTLSQIIEREPPEPRKLNSRLPQDLETITLKCLRKDARDRYGTAEALAQDLRRFVRGDPVEARPQPTIEKLARNAWKHRRKALVALVVLALVVCVAWLALDAQRDDRRRREAAYAPKVFEALRLMRLSRMSGRTSADFDLGVFPWGFSVVPPSLGKMGLLEDGGIGPLGEAVDKLSEAVASLPDRADAYWHRARLHLLLGDEEAALDDLDAATRTEPDLVPARLVQATLLEKRNGSTRIETEQAATDGWAAFWLEAQRASKKKEWAKAAAAFERSLASVDGEAEPYAGWSLETRLGKGVALLMDKRAVEALQEFAVVRHEWPGAVDVSLLEGAALRYLGGDHKLRADERFDALYHRSQFQGFEGEVAHAIFRMYGLADFLTGRRRVLEEESEHYLAWIDRISPPALREWSRSLHLRTLGKRQATVAAILAVFDLAAPNASLCWILAKNLSNLGEIEKSIEVVRRGLEIEPQSGTGNAVLATCLARTGKKEEARERLRLVEKLHPPEERDAQLSFDVAFLYKNLGDYETALRIFDEALAKAPRANTYDQKGHVLSSLAKSAAGSKQQELYDRALEAFDAGIRMDPKFSFPYQSKGLLLVALGHQEEAIEAFRGACGARPPEPRNYWELGRLLDETGAPAAEAFSVYVDGLEVDAASGPLHAKVTDLLGGAADLGAGPERLIAILTKEIAGAKDSAAIGRMAKTLSMAQQFVAR